MELHQLKTFVTVAKLGSITKASGALHLSQPAVSAHIKMIEETLGLVLFERTARGMGLTNHGRHLLSKAQDTLSAHKSFLSEATQIKDCLTGKLRLGASTSLGEDLGEHLLAKLTELYPKIEVSLQHLTSKKIVESIREGKLDAGFYNETATPEADFIVTEINQFGLYLAAPKDFSETDSSWNWEQLEQATWIIPEPQTCCGKAAASLFAKHSIKPAKIIRVDRESIIKSLIADGIGIGILHADTAINARKDGQIQLLSEANTITRTLFARQATRREDPLLRAILSILKERNQSARA